MALNKGFSTKKQQTKQTGDIGEKIAVKYLKSKGFLILDTNYTKKWGELDIVASNNHIVHFVEVKTFSYPSKTALERSFVSDQWRPEELVDDRKLRQIKKAAQTWIFERKWKGECQVDVVAVRMVPSEQYATVNHIDNIVA